MLKSVGIGFTTLKNVVKYLLLPCNEEIPVCFQKIDGKKKEKEVVKSSTAILISSS
jgi:hypothetical protein